jgi:hypothetical protein
VGEAVSITSCLLASLLFSCPAVRSRKSLRLKIIERNCLFLSGTGSSVGQDGLKVPRHTLAVERSEERSIGILRFSRAAVEPTGKYIPGVAA